MESKGRVEGETGVLSVNMNIEFMREGSKKDGYSLGLEGEVKEGIGSVEGERISEKDEEAGRDGKYSRGKEGGPSKEGV